VLDERLQVSIVGNTHRDEVQPVAYFLPPTAIETLFLHFAYYFQFNLHELLVCFLLAIYVTLIYIVPIAQLWTLINRGVQNDPPSSSKVKKL
jgi:hypothetical protein